jgi:carbamoyl-phosphate synthase large subunit
METLSIGISGINAADNPGPGVGVARSLKEDASLVVDLVGLAYDTMEPGIYMDWLIGKSFSLPYPSGDGPVFISRLLHIKETHGLDQIIPCLDAELPVYIKYADTLREHGIRTFLPTMEQFRLRGKDRLSEVSSKIGTHLPRTAIATSDDMLYQAIQRIGLPVMVKGIYYEAYKAYSVQEAVLHYRKLVAKWGYPIIVQEVVPGEELNVIGLGDGKGQALGLVAMKKVALTSLGKVWSGVTVDHPALLAAAEAFVREYKWRGPFELECIVRDDEICLIEINPRFPAWVYFATGVGVNLPSMLVRCCQGLSVKPVTEYQAGKLLVRYTHEFVTDMEPLQMLVTTGETP